MINKIKQFIILLIIFITYIFINKNIKTDIKNDNIEKEIEKLENKLGIINYNGEFGYELQLVLPYAYYLYKNNKLSKTISSKNTSSLYYFSKNHVEKYTERNYVIPRVPNKTPHVYHLNYSKWIPPPLKEMYKNDFYVFDKKICIIHNKFNEEWNGQPVNFIDIDTLEKLFNILSDKYYIIYLRPKNIIKDNSKIYSLKGEKKLIAKYNIKTGDDLYNETKDKFNVKDFNHFQLLIHSNSSNFISVQGGNCVLASYFGGINIIYAKLGREMENNSYDGHYKKYSNCDVYHTDSYQSLINMVQNKF